MTNRCSQLRQCNDLKNGVSLYGVRFGCVNTTNHPNCNKCAELIGNAVSSVLWPGHGRVDWTTADPAEAEL